MERRAAHQSGHQLRQRRLEKHAVQHQRVPGITQRCSGSSHWPFAAHQPGAPGLLPGRDWDAPAPRHSCQRRPLRASRHSATTASTLWPQAAPAAVPPAQSAPCGPPTLGQPIGWTGPGARTSVCASVPSARPWCSRKQDRSWTPIRSGRVSISRASLAQRHPPCKECRREECGPRDRDGSCKPCSGWPRSKSGASRRPQAMVDEPAVTPRTLGSAIWSVGRRCCLRQTGRGPENGLLSEPPLPARSTRPRWTFELGTFATDGV